MELSAQNVWKIIFSTMINVKILVSQVIGEIHRLEHVINAIKHAVNALKAMKVHVLLAPQHLFSFKIINAKLLTNATLHFVFFIFFRKIIILL